MTDSDELRRITLNHGAMTHFDGSHGDKATAKISLNRKQLSQMIMSGKPFLECFDDNMLPCNGESETVRQLLQCLDDFYPMFNILEP
jgi:alkyl sulfatase BDS1-like metallo-beta-lactamase superfamily hydrolase